MFSVSGQGSCAPFTALAILAATVNVPISIYVGRIPLGQAPGHLLREVCWVVALAVLTRLVWSRAARRVTSQGG
nr:hypothetical protein OG461_06555 [Streptomyces sp. NBC_00995]